MDPMKNYYNEVFARNYDRLTTNGYYDYSVKANEFNKSVEGNNILEIGIGTGILAKEILNLGFNVEGIEPSQDMINILEEKDLPIKVYKQDASEFNTGKQYDAIFSHGTAPQCILREEVVCFDTHVTNNEDFKNAMKNVFKHLKLGGLFLCGVQSSKSDNISVGDFYKNESTREKDLLTKTHRFREGEEWVSQTVTAKIWPEHEYVKMMESIGFKKLGHNKNKTWYVFKKI